MREYVHLQPWMVDRIVTIKTKHTSHVGKLASYERQPAQLNFQHDDLLIWFAGRRKPLVFKVTEFTSVIVEDNA